MTTLKPLPLERTPFTAGLWPQAVGRGVDAVGAPPEVPRTDFRRIDVVRAVAGLRHIDRSGEPAMVFSHLAAVCVPSVCDEVVIDIVENGQGYRIRRPAAESTAVRTVPVLPADPQRPALLSSDSVAVAIPRSRDERGGSVFEGSVVCTWTDGYEPTPTDASLVQLMVDHAAALVQLEQTAGAASGVGHGKERLHGALPRNRRIASAVGVVMALHHVDHVHAMDLLIRISDRSHIDLHDLADAVVSTGSLPAVRRPVEPH